MRYPTFLPVFALLAAANAQDCTPELTSTTSPRGDFGAALAADGDVLVVGAPLADLTPGGPPQHPYGRAEVFEYDPTQRAWGLLQVLAPPQSPLPVINNEGFASSIAIDDGTLLCGWPDDITGGNGSVRPFRRGSTAAGWVAEDPLLPPFASATGRFGTSVATRGGEAVVGEQLGDGRVHVFRRSATGGTWAFVETLEPPAVPGSLTGTFGRSVALQGDWLFIGDPGHLGALHGSGHVFVFRRAPGGWQFSQRLSAANTNPLTADGFGASLAVEAGGLHVGANQDVVPPGGQTGAVYVFQEGAGGQWVPRQLIAPPATSGSRSFGSDVDVSGDAMLVGAPRAPWLGAQVGFAYLYERDPVLDRWALVGRYTQQPLGNVDPRAGEAVAVGHWHAVLGLPGAQQVRATAAFPTRDVDADTMLDSCEALHDPTPCPVLPNATGFAGRIHVDGTLDVNASGTQLAADRLTPHSFGYFIVSRTFSNAPIPGGTPFGILCLAGDVGRYNAHVLDSGAAGRVHLTIDPLQIPQPAGPVAAQPGETWYFEYWHRDVAAVSGRPTAFTETARVTFE